MGNNVSHTPSELLRYLPAIYQEEPFLGQFLLAFEKILLGRDANVSFPEVEANFPEQGLEETIANLAVYFDPLHTPEEFLPWLANWTAFTLRADLSIQKQREFIARIIQLYQWRGTKKNLQELLQIFTTGVPTVIELQSERFQVGVHSTVGVDTYIGGGLAHYFQVTIALDRKPATVLNRQIEIARSLIDLEKPAHTYYDLTPSFPTMQINVHSTVGVDTLLGTLTQEN